MTTTMRQQGLAGRAHQWSVCLSDVACRSDVLTTASSRQLFQHCARPQDVGKHFTNHNCQQITHILCIARARSHEPDNNDGFLKKHKM